MYLTPYQKKQLTTIIILIIGIPLVLFGGYSAVRWFTGAGTDTQPKNIVLANLTTSSVVVTWTTEGRQRGSVVPVLNGSDQSTVIDERGNIRVYTHYVELTSLEPGTKYDFKIISGSDTYTSDDDTEFSFTTANITTDTPVPKPVYGTLEDINDEDAVVYISPKDKSTYPVATIPSSSGNWLIDLSSLRKISDKTFYEIPDSTDLIIIATSGVDNAGIAEGIYEDIFDSSGELTESLVASGGEYDLYISNSAKLMASIKDGNTSTSDITLADNEIGYTSSLGGSDEEESFDREYELKSDLVWTDLVSSGNSTSGTPEEYGLDTVITTNLTDVSFTVLWYSEDEEVGYIMYSETSDNLSNKGRDERDGISSQGEYFLHSIEVTDLDPETTYYFKIYSGTEVYDKIYEVTTFSTQSSPPEFETIAGTVNARDYENFVVIATFTDEDGSGSSGSSYPVSTLVDSEGSWILTIGSTRGEDGEYFEKSNGDTVTFNSMYLIEPKEIEATVGEATMNEIELTVNEDAVTFVKIPLLDDYGVFIN